MRAERQDPPPPPYGAVVAPAPVLCRCVPINGLVGALAALTLLAGAVDLATGGALVRAALVAAEAEAEAPAASQAAFSERLAALRFERAAAWCWLLGAAQSAAGAAGLYGVLARRPGFLRAYQLYLAVGLVAVSAAQLHALFTLRPVCEQALAAGAASSAADAARLAAQPGASTLLPAQGTMQGSMVPARLRAMRRCVDVASACVVLGLLVAWTGGAYCLKQIGNLALLYSPMPVSALVELPSNKPARKGGAGGEEAQPVPAGERGATHKRKGTANAV